MGDQGGGSPVRSSKRAIHKQSNINVRDDPDGVDGKLVSKTVCKV